MAVGVDGVELVRVIACVHRRFGVFHTRVDQTQLVIVGVANRGHAMTVGWPGRMDLHVQSEALSRVRDLHQPGDAAVVIRIRAHEIGAIGNDVVHV